MRELVDTSSRVCYNNDTSLCIPFWITFIWQYNSLRTNTNQLFPSIHPSIHHRHLKKIIIMTTILSLSGLHLFGSITLYGLKLREHQFIFFHPSIHPSLLLQKKWFTRHKGNWLACMRRKERSVQ